MLVVWCGTPQSSCDLQHAVQVCAVFAVAFVVASDDQVLPGLPASGMLALTS